MQSLAGPGPQPCQVSRHICLCVSIFLLFWLAFFACLLLCLFACSIDWSDSRLVAWSFALPRNGFAKSSVPLVQLLVPMDCRELFLAGPGGISMEHPRLEGQNSSDMNKCF